MVIFSGCHHFGHQVSSNVEIFGTRLSDGMQAIFLFFTASRSESVWGSYDWICVCTRHAIALHQNVKNFVASVVDMAVDTRDSWGYCD